MLILMSLILTELSPKPHAEKLGIYILTDWYMLLSPCSSAVDPQSLWTLFLRFLHIQSL